MWNIFYCRLSNELAKVKISKVGDTPHQKPKQA